jgi:hypothetical protein
MKILKARNGIALVAVLVIMLISSLFIPLMFNLSDTSLMIAVKGTDRQRASYLARTITEMSVAAFKKFDSIENSKLTDAQKTVRTGIDNLLNGSLDKIETTPVAMFSTMVDGTEYYRQNVGEDGKKLGTPIKISEADYIILNQNLSDLPEESKKPYELIVKEDVKVEQLVYSTVGSDDYNAKKAAGSGFTYLGEGNCTLTYEGGTKYYKKWTSDDATTGHKAGDIEEIGKSDYEKSVKDFTDAVIAGTSSALGWEVSSVNNKNVYFTTTAKVNGATSRRSCVLILQTYPTEDNWFKFKPESGGNQIFVDPNKATSRVPISYDRGLSGMSDYKGQALLVYSSIGNMIIANGAVKDESGNPQSAGLNNTQFVLGVEPGLNTTPNNDPSWSIIDGANYDASVDLAQVNNFVAFTSTKAIRVDLPVNLMLNPCRANRIGDGIGTPNGSLFKIMLFQAPDIIFEGSVDMMMSFYVRGTEKARRMSSVVLNAPSSTPYHYEHEQYGRTVKAGRVFFAEDSYLWIIPYGDDGSASSWTGLLSETVYKKDSDFQKVKIANAGDVYYFNAEVTKDTAVKDAQGNATGETITDFVGFSLTGYFLETKYLPDYQDENTKSWWNVWNNTQAAIFGNYMEGQLEDATYVEDDFHYVGNLNDGVSLIEYPEVDDYYVIWEN